MTATHHWVVVLYITTLNLYKNIRNSFFVLHLTGWETERSYFTYPRSRSSKWQKPYANHCLYNFDNLTLCSSSSWPTEVKLLLLRGENDKNQTKTPDLLEPCEDWTMAKNRLSVEGPRNSGDILQASSAHIRSLRKDLRFHPPAAGAIKSQSQVAFVRTEAVARGEKAERRICRSRPLSSC